MKAKILSMLLLVAMLITAVPVMVSAEEAATESEQIQQATNNEATADTTPGDLHDWYVKDGLTALYSTFGANNGVNLTNGTWTSKVGTGVATLGTKARWSAGEFGGIGYTVLYGTVAEDGSYVKESSFNNHNNTNLYLGFGLSQLNNGDFTVEYMAMQKPLYVADAEGKILVKDGKKVESYDAFGEKGLPTGLASDKQLPVDMLGWVTSWSNCIDDAYWKGGRGELYWIYDNNTWYAGRNGYRLDAFTKNDPLKNNNVVGTYALWMDESVTVTPATEEGAEDVTVTSADFQLYRNATKYSAVSFSTENIGKDAAIIWHDAGTAFKSGAKFLLSRATPIDFFSVRIYDRALTISEMRQNRAVDILLYYGIALDASVVANAAAQKAVCGAIYDFEIVTDATAKAAKKAELETLVENAKIIGLYAAPESMTSFFTIYVPDSINLTTGKWADLIGGDAAKMQTPSRWFVNADGSFGYNVFVGWIDADGKANRGLDPKNGGWNVNSDQAGVAALGNVPTANHAYYKNNALTFDMNKLPAEDFTVEYLAKYRPFLVADAAKSTKDQIVYAKDAEGNLIEAYNLFGTTPATTDYGYPSPRSMDAFGHFTVVTQSVDSTSGWGSSVRGTQHYMYKCHDWRTQSQRNWLGSGSWGATSGLALKGDAYKQNDVINLYTITLDETKDESGALSANFGLYRNAALYNQSNGVITWSDTAPSKTYTGELASNAEFYLSAGQPTDFYAVRVYNKALTAAEKAQNLGADVILYYGIELDDKTLANKELVEAILASASVVKIETDASAKATNKAALEEKIATFVKTVTIQVGSVVLDTLEVFGDMLTLPTLVNGKFVIGWRVEGVEGNVAPGTEISVSDGMTLAPVLFTIPATRLAPDVKVATSAEDLAVRFTAELYRADYVALCKMYGAENITLGMLITPDAYVQKAGGVFTRKALRKMVDDSTSTSGAAYVEVAADGFYRVEKNILTVAGSIYNFQDRTYEKNPKFAAVAFIDVDTDADGRTDFTVYGSYDQKASVSVKDAMTSARENMSTTQKEWIDSLLAKFGA